MQFFYTTIFLSLFLKHHLTISNHLQIYVFLIIHLKSFAEKFSPEVTLEDNLWCLFQFSGSPEAISP